LIISSYFTTFPGGRRADAGYIKIKANLSPVELNWGLAELGRRERKNAFISGHYVLPATLGTKDYRSFIL
jgi:hypothetical protein